MKHEGGAGEVPFKTEVNVDNPNLLNGMASEELALLANAADPFAMSPVQTSAATANSNVGNPSEITGGERFRRCNGDCVNVQRMPSG